MPEVGFDKMRYTVVEGVGRLTVGVVSNQSVPDGVVQVDINNLTATG